MLLWLPNQCFPYFRFKIAQPKICLQPADTSQLMAVNVTRPLVFAAYSCWACGFPFLCPRFLPAGRCSGCMSTACLHAAILRLCSQGNCPHCCPGNGHRLELQERARPRALLSGGLKGMCAFAAVAAQKQTPVSTSHQLFSYCFYDEI